MAKRSSSDGFTLIELMIVVVIMAVLVAVAVIAYTRHIKNSRIVDAKAFVAAIQSREESYRQQFGLFFDAANTACNPTCTGVAGGSDVFYPSFASYEPVAKQWAPATTTGWVALGLRPESGSPYFQFTVRASYPSTVAANNHALYNNACNFCIPAQPGSGATCCGVAAGAGTVVQPWYYIVAQGDLAKNDNGGNCSYTNTGGAGTKCTSIIAVSASATGSTFFTRYEEQ